MLELQHRPADLLKPGIVPKVLDVGAGPLTYLGKRINGTTIDLISVDIVANVFNKLLEKHKIEPIIRTQKCSAETLTKMFASNSFDLVFARNCIDHSYNPEKAILQMLEVVKKDCYVLMEHRLNEGITEKYSGLHQWNFFYNEKGDFIIGSRTDQVNITEKYKNNCEIKCEMASEGNDGDWLITRIRKL
jgi:ubiquinone/menaquinone biosynthesis C-methylase UbiE